MHLDYTASSISHKGFPVGSVVKNLPENAEDMEMWVRSLDLEDSLEKETGTHSSFLFGKSHGQRILVDYSPWSHKETDTT